MSHGSQPGSFELKLTSSTPAKNQHLDIGNDENESSLALSNASTYDLDNKETYSDKSGRKSSLTAVHVVDASTSSAATSKLALITGQERDEDSSPLSPDEENPPVYRMYKRRWIGVCALVLLNIIKGCNWVWFGAIANGISNEFGFTLSQVNMLGNVPHISYLAFSWCVPLLVRRWGLRWSSVFGASIMLLSAWLRLSGTAHGLSTSGSYGLMILAQILIGITAPCFQVVGPRYAEVWFDLQGRATTTMIVAISDPLGTAIGQIIPPFITNYRFGILVLALATTLLAPLCFAVLPQPPTPPTYSGSLTSPPLLQTLRAAIGRARKGEQFLTKTERLDFFILFFIFGVLVAGTSSFSVFIAQIFQPYGYSEVLSGIMGGVFLLSGLVAAIFSAPIFDRVLVHHLAKTVKVLLPALGVVWIGLVFAVRPNNLAGVFIVLVLIASISFILLPVGLELGVEITRNAETSTAVLWTGGNAVSFLWVLVMDALRAPETADPPKHMRNALIFNASFIAATACLVVFFTGAQTRRKKDEEMARLGNARAAEGH
ncbi:hypothetical protein M408DRAFT_333098 [Serendipita vermifera MAFF 305830]|uniref:Major facilitator superfamily (MFS) profile domain-containing protein n=1 Tax=Serendipita vermifera MAFF 305830 TaxID=933852 RepID=A0A0C3ABM1_SERVB|nr:hypothetical protein M408DRAFT_333098 [Serendipita vermifera MAFF 305830]